MMGALRLRWLTLCVASVAVLALAAFTIAQRRRAWPPAAVVLLTVDTLRADAVSFDTSAAARTPFLATLARDAVVFNNAYAPSSWTVPSMASLFTSLAPRSHGVTRGAAVRRQPVLPATLTTLAESLHQAGYVTIGAPTNPHMSAQRGFDQGFDFYGPTKVEAAPGVTNQLRKLLQQAFGAARLDGQAGKRPFVWVHYMDPHAPYTPHQPWAQQCAERSLPVGEELTEISASFLLKQNEDEEAPFSRRARCLYESEVGFVDEQLRQLNDTLGLDRDDVLLIFTADHGEELADHRHFGHARTLYEEVLRVPLFVRWPRGLPTAAHVDTLVDLVDIYPTLLDLLGIRPPVGLQGRSLVPLLHGAALPAQPHYFELTLGQNEMAAVRDGNWKLIRGRKAAQLFDVASDPHEHADLVAARPDVVSRLDTTLRDGLAALPAAPHVDSVELTPDTMERLRQLGYDD